MKNKVLIKLIVPSIDETFDLFIPVNEILWKVKRMIIKSINDLVGESLDIEREYVVINKTTGKMYGDNSIIYETDIRNATELVLLEEKNGTTLENIAIIQ